MVLHGQTLMVPAGMPTPDDKWAQDVATAFSATAVDAPLAAALRDSVGGAVDDALAASLEGGGGPQLLAGGLLPEARAAIASGLRRPETLAPSLPWTLAGFRGDPYAPEFQLKALSTLLRRRRRRLRRLDIEQHAP